MTTIGVIADTHIRAGGKRQLPPQVWETFKKVDLILHAGDLTSPHVLTDLEALAPVLAVCGNNDGWELTNELPQTQRIPVEGCTIGLVHGDLPARGVITRALPFEGNRATAANALSHFEHDGDIDCVVFGHSHRPLCERYQAGGRSILLFNPGSPTDKRYGPLYGLGLLHVEGKTLRGETVNW